ncbi:MAG: carboxypeptidase regulatory-like domain-containing protein [Planctomycetes bacterium]|nr:carboxypeptidase regulatory-like domain-containing protein [Planctomycetota bacterium]
MSASRIGGANLLLLVITLGAVLFGAWSFLYNNAPSVAANIPLRAADLDLTDPPVTESPGTRPKHSTQPEIIRPAQPPGTTDGHSTTQPPANTSGKFEVKLPESSPSDSGDARMEGKVIGPDGKPCAGATVTALRAGFDATPPEFNRGDLEAYRDRMAAFLEHTARQRRQTTTDSRGIFTFTGLDPRLAYNLSAVAEGVGSGTATSIAATDSPVVLISADASLQGRVQTIEGTPVTAFTVRHWRANREWEARSQSFNHPEGRFSLPSKPGSLYCEVTAPGLSQGSPAEATVGPQAPELVITLARAAQLSGTVRDQAGNPLAGAQVYLGAARNEERGGRWGGEWANTPTATSDSKGRYLFDSLPPRTHTVTATFGEATSTQTIDAKAGENTLDFALEGGARVVLRLTDATGQPVQADEVWFQAKAGNWPRAIRLPPREPGLTEFAGLKPGEYTATINSAGWPSLRKPVTIKDGDNQFEFQFAQGATLSGIVTGAGGVSLTGVAVRLRKDEEDAYGGWGTGRYSQVAADGKYKLGPAEPGQWKLELYATDGWKLVHSSTITLAVGENNHNLTVDSGGSLVVTVTDEAGSPVAWAEVQIRGEQSYNGRTDQSGRAVISFIQPGAYTVYSSSRALSSKSVSVSVRNGENPLGLQLLKANCSRITHVYPDTQAARLGVQVGDLVYEYNGEAISSWRALSAAIRKTRATDNVAMQVERNGQILTFNLKGGTVGIEGADGVR